MAKPQQQFLHFHGLSGGAQGTVAVFPAKKKVTIGRTAVNAFQIKHDTISQRHAFIVCNKNGQWLVTDSDSSNGTKINGVSVTPGVPTELRDGDHLAFGPSNEVSVRITSNLEEDEEEDQEKEEEEEVMGNKGGKSVSLGDWIGEEIDRLAVESASLAEGEVRELVKFAEAQKALLWERLR